MKEKRSIFKTILNVFFYLVIVVLVMFSIANIKVKRENDIPNIFGIGFLAVQSDSMEGSNKDSFNKGDLIIVKILNDKSKEDLKIGDVVTFYDLTIRQFNTHRVVDINTGNKTVTTKGDNTVGNDNPVALRNVLAVHKSTIGNAGSKLDYLRSPIGFALFIILPIFVIFVITGVGLVKNVMDLNKEKYEQEYKQSLEQAKQEPTKENIIEEEREKIRQEILKEQEREKIRQELLEEMKEKKED